MYNYQIAVHIKHVLLTHLYVSLRKYMIDYILTISLYFDKNICPMFNTLLFIFSPPKSFWIKSICIVKFPSILYPSTVLIQKQINFFVWIIYWNRGTVSLLQHLLHWSWCCSFFVMSENNVCFFMLLKDTHLVLLWLHIEKEG